MADVANNAGWGQNDERSIREMQQSIAETVCGNITEWDILLEHEPEHLKHKINYITQDKNVRKDMFNGVWNQRKYSNRNSLTSIIFVMVVDTNSDIDNIDYMTNYSCHPVFRAYRCTSDNINSNNCCMIFVDEQGRVYQNWGAYLVNNVLPAGIMVAPRCGVYNLIDGIVQLEMQLTPAASLRSKTFDILDATIQKLEMLAPIAKLLPVAAPIVDMADAVRLACAGYAAARSCEHLIDRSNHEQSTGVDNCSARKHWISIGAFCAAGAMHVMKKSSGPEDNRVNQYIVNGLDISCLIISGSGVALGVIDLFRKYQDDGVISSMDVLRISTSLKLFVDSAHGASSGTRKFIEDVAKSGLSLLVSRYVPEIMNRIMQGESIGSVLSFVKTKFSEDVGKYIHNMSKIIMVWLKREVKDKIHINISQESVKYRIAMMVLNTIAECTTEQLESQRSRILYAVKEYILSLNQIDANGSRKNCEVCGGYYTICDL